jgi:hypothetical protein
MMSFYSTFYSRHFKRYGGRANPFIPLIFPRAVHFPCRLQPLNGRFDDHSQTLTDIKEVLYKRICRASDRSFLTQWSACNAQHKLRYQCEKDITSLLLIYIYAVAAEWFSASDVSDLQACNQCLCGVWVRSQLTALDIKRIFGADHVPEVSSGHSGFLHHQNWKLLISSIIGSSEGGFRPRPDLSAFMDIYLRACPRLRMQD